MIATTDSQPGANRPAKVGLIFTDWLSGGFGEEICLNPLTSRYFQIWGMPLPLFWSRWIKSKLSCARVQRHLENKPLFIMYWMTAFMELSRPIFLIYDGLKLFYYLQIFKLWCDSWSQNLHFQILSFISEKIRSPKGLNLGNMSCEFLREHVLLLLLGCEQ